MTGHELDALLLECARAGLPGLAIRSGSPAVLGISGHSARAAGAPVSLQEALGLLQHAYGENGPGMVGTGHVLSFRHEARDKDGTAGFRVFANSTRDGDEAVVSVWFLADEDSARSVAGGRSLMFPLPSRVQVADLDGLLDWCVGRGATSVTLLSGEPAWMEMPEGTMRQVSSRKVAYPEVMGLLASVYGSNGPGLVEAGAPVFFRHEAGGQARPGFVFDGIATCRVSRNGKGASLDFELRQEPVRPD